MNRVCDRCDEEYEGKSFHITSFNDDGKILLDSVVCYWCARIAKELELQVEPVRWQ